MSERQYRIELAAACRLAARFGWQEAVANRFSLAVSDDGRCFLMNRRWRDFAAICASDLALLDGSEPDLTDIDSIAWAIHGAMHRLLPQARCVMHVHSAYATALSTLQDPRLLPVDQTSARFFNRVAIDESYGAFADSGAEGERLAAAMGKRKILLMRNHGLMVTGANVAEAFDQLYHFEQAARTLMLAYASGRPLRVLDDAIAEQTARAWEAKPKFAHEHFAQMRAGLDPGYRDQSQEESEHFFF
jgi:ribulose-5-phosphate 4-epimerase/fuculose-1-phosphate aldolase